MERQGQVRGRVTALTLSHGQVGRARDWTGAMSQEREGSFPSSLAVALCRLPVQIHSHPHFTDEETETQRGRDLPRATLPVRDRARPARRPHSIRDLATSFRESDGA